MTEIFSGEKLERMDGLIDHDGQKITDKREPLGSNTGEEDEMQFHQLENKHFDSHYLRDNIGGRALR
jgi:hypothetical protein